MTNDEALWRRRFLILTAGRLSGTLLILFGVLLAFSDVFVPGGSRLAGLLVSLAGLVDLFLFPAMIAQRWRQP